jgi:hypothetical protein
VGEQDDSDDPTVTITDYKLDLQLRPDHLHDAGDSEEMLEVDQLSDPPRGLHLHGWLVLRQTFECPADHTRVTILVRTLLATRERQMPGSEFVKTLPEGGDPIIDDMPNGWQADPIGEAEWVVVRDMAINERPFEKGGDAGI